MTIKLATQILLKFQKIRSLFGSLYLDRVTGRLSIVVYDDPFKATTIYSEFRGMCKPTAINKPTVATFNARSSASS
jgi:hypothetical protein